MKFFLIILSSLLLLNANAELALNSDNFLYEQDKKSLTTSVFFVLKSGSTLDPTRTPGLSNIAFNALLRGTKNKSRAELAAAIERLGADISVSVDFHHTIITLTTINENIAPAIQLFAEVILEPAFRPYEVKPLQNEIVAKLNLLKSNNRQLLFRAYRRKIYQGTPLEFPPSGYPQAIQAMSLYQIPQQYKQVMKKDNAFFAAITALDEGKIKKQIAAAFERLPEGQAPSNPEIKAKPVVGRQFFVVPRKDTSTTEYIIGDHGFKADYPDRLVLETAIFSFGNDFSSRVMSELRKKKGWTYGAYAHYNFLGVPRSYGGLYSFYSFPQKQFTEQAILKSVELIEEYVKNGLTDAELDYAKQSLRNSYPFKFVKASSRLMARIYEKLDNAPFYTVNEFRNKIDKVSKKAVLRAIKKVHSPESLLFVAVGDAEQLRKVAAKIPGIKNITIIRDPLSK